MFIFVNLGNKERCNQIKLTKMNCIDDNQFTGSMNMNKSETS